MILVIKKSFKNIHWNVIVIFYYSSKFIMIIKNGYKNLIKNLDDKIELKSVDFLKYLDFYFFIIME